MRAFRTENISARDARVSFRECLPKHDSNLVPRVSHLGGSKMRDPGNEVDLAGQDRTAMEFRKKTGV